MFTHIHLSCVYVSPWLYSYYCSFTSYQLKEKFPMASSFRRFTSVESKDCAELWVWVYTLTYQNLQKSRVHIYSILGSIIRTYKKVGFGRLR